jgi:hypothetical protein
LQLERYGIKVGDHIVIGNKHDWGYREIYGERAEVTGFPINNQQEDPSPRAIELGIYVQVSNFRPIGSYVPKETGKRSWVIHSADAVAMTSEDLLNTLPEVEKDLPTIEA